MIVKRIATLNAIFNKYLERDVEISEINKYYDLSDTKENLCKVYETITKSDEYKNKQGKIKHEKIYSIIPLNIFQTFHTLNFPPKIKTNIELLKNQTKEFNHFLYDDEMCSDFIKKHFDEDVFNTYTKLKVGPYKTDLWKYCALYIYGGIYLDINYYCLNDFRLIELTDKEYFVSDNSDSENGGICNTLLSCLPNNKKIYACIYKIVESVKNNIITECGTHINGQYLLTTCFNSAEIKSLELFFNGESVNNKYNVLLKINNSCLDEQKHFIHKYNTLWVNYDVYNYPILVFKKKKDFSNKTQKKLLGNDYVFNSSAPTIVEIPNNRYLINLRWATYKYDENGTWHDLNSFIHKNPKSLNSRFIVDKNFNKINEETFLEENIEVQKDSHFDGLEDIRIFKFNELYYYSATVFDEKREIISISIDTYNINDSSYKLTKNIILPTMYDLNKIKIWEKNWSFLQYKGKLCVVYNWFPLQIATIDKKKSELSILDIKYNMPDYFKDTRGNTCGYIKKNEIWFIVHKAKGRNYLHFFAIFDLNMNLLRYSELFKFGGFVIEFCLSLIVKDNELIISYSLLDCQSIIATYDLTYINNSIKWYSSSHTFWSGEVVNK
jgi:predicted GH43/DUF377 family glycosyl hydrolase